VSGAPRLSAFRTVRAAALAGALAASLAACGGASRGGPASRDAVVLIDCNVPDASLFVDGRFLAPVSLVRGGIALSPGVHRLELRHDAYLGRFLELTLGPAERRRVDAQLFPILP
jgi:hypothetical protein